jgi:hypothetical protein
MKKVLFYIRIKGRKAKVWGATKEVIVCKIIEHEGIPQIQSWVGGRGGLPPTRVTRLYVPSLHVANEWLVDALVQYDFDGSLWAEALKKREWMPIDRFSEDELSDTAKEEIRQTVIAISEQCHE